MIRRSEDSSALTMFGYLGAGENLTSYNLYAYCGNNPVMLSDNSGCSPWWESFWKGLGIFAGAIIVVAAIAIIPVATGDSAIPVFVGAAIGASVSGGISIGIQLATTGTIDAGKLLVEMSIGGVMGAFGGSALCRNGMTIAGGSVGFCGSFAGDWVAVRQIDYVKALGAGALGSLIAFARGSGAQNGQLGARQAVLATRQQILARNASGGYRSPSNFQFALRSNAGRVERATSSLNQVAFRSIIFNTVNTFELNFYQYMLFN